MNIRHLFGAAFAVDALTSKALSPDSANSHEQRPWEAVAANIDELFAWYIDWEAESALLRLLNDPLNQAGKLLDCVDDSEHDDKRNGLPEVGRTTMPCEPQ